MIESVSFYSLEQYHYYLWLAGEREYDREPPPRRPQSFTAGEFPDREPADREG